MGEHIQLSSGTAADILAPDRFEHTWRIAKLFASSKLVPAHFQGKPEEAMVALALAQQLKVNPLLAMQNIFVVKGTPGFKSSFVIALANERGPFADPIQFEESGSGQSLAVRAFAKIRSTGTIVDFTVSMSMAKAEGWTANPKYASMPQLMLRYRAAALLVRLYCPEVLMGYQTAEELEDVNGGARGPRVIDAGTVSAIDGLNAAIAGELPAALDITPQREPGEDPADEADL
jgi:hypothetical protein